MATNTRTSSLVSTSRRVAPMSSISGIRTSITTTSGSKLDELLDRLTAVDSLADDFDVLLRLQDHPETAAHQSLVVGEQNADGHAPPRTGPSLERRTHRPEPRSSPASHRRASGARASRRDHDRAAFLSLEVLARFIGDLDLQSPVDVAEQHARARGARMPEVCSSMPPALRDMR